MISFEEGEAHGAYFVTSRLDNVHSNTCTHIDFPGHLPQFGSPSCKTVGEYALDRFIGPVLIVDCRYKLAATINAFDNFGHFAVGHADNLAMLKFLQSLDSMEITEAEITAAAEAQSASVSELKGVLFFSGLTHYWQYKLSDSWEHRYFFNPFLSDDACDLIVRSKLSFVGIDALQIEHPIINYRGDELPIILNTECRNFVAQRLSGLDKFSNHKALLSNDILMYENLRIPDELAGRRVEFYGAPLNFQIPGMIDNALVRPFAVMDDSL